MERTKKKPAFRTVLKWLVVAAIALAVLYHLPLRRSVSMTMQNQETGESAALSMELTLRRSFFARTRVQGALVFDGEPYTSVLKVTTDLSPLETLQCKLHGIALADAFCRDDAMGGLIYGDGELELLNLHLDRRNVPDSFQLYRRRDGSFWSPQT